MHENAFGGRAPPRPAGGASSIPPDLLAGLRERGRGGRRQGEGRGRGRRKGGDPPQCLKCVDANAASNLKCGMRHIF